MDLEEIVALFLLVKSSRFETQELLKDDCRIWLHYDCQQIGHLSYFMKRKRFISYSPSLYHLILCKFPLQEFLNA